MKIKILSRIYLKSKSSRVFKLWCVILPQAYFCTLCKLMVVFKENWYCLYMLFWANGAWLWNSVIILHESMQMGNWKIWSSSLMEFYLINEKENVLKTEDSDSRVKSLSQKLFTTKALLILSRLLCQRKRCLTLP